MASTLVALGVAIASLSLFPGCDSCHHGPSVDAGAPVEAAVTVAAVSPAALSLPLAADHDTAGRVYVAGYVAADKTVDLSQLDDTGRLLWHTSALDALSFSSDAHLDVVAARHGAIVVWRGLQHGKRVRVGRWIGDDGKAGAAPFEVAADACAVGDELLSVGKAGSAVVVKHLPDGAPKTLLSIPDGMDITLACGEATRAYIIEEGEDDLAVRPVKPADAATLPRVVLLGSDDLGDDEVREHEDFTSGESLGEVVLTEQGHFVLRQVTEAGAQPKRTLDRVLGPDEGFMTADASKTHAAVVLTRDAAARCDGDVATDVVAIDVPLEGDGKERVVDVGHGDCGKDLGPYWVAPTDDAIYVAWPVRGPRVGTRAPVEALVVTKLGDLTSKTIPLSAEDVVFAGCHANRCAFAALMRPEGTDGMAPGEARVVVIP